MDSLSEDMENVRTLKYIQRGTLLKEIYQILHNTPHAVVLTGPPGIGQTETARKHAQSYKCYKSVLWIDYSSAETMRRDIKIYVPVKDRGSMCAEYLLRDCYQCLTVRRILLVLDNVICLKDIQCFLRILLPKGAERWIDALLTSVSNNIWDYAGDLEFKKFPIKEWTPLASRQFITTMFIVI